jgi:hypothetical protein
MTVRHVVITEHQQIAHLGRRTRYRCRTCGEHGPWASRDAAEEGRDKHERRTAA